MVTASMANSMPASKSIGCTKQNSERGNGRNADNRSSQHGAFLDADQILKKYLQSNSTALG
jgi:hypothetical protein